jgi:hypothetical protein
MDISSLASARNILGGESFLFTSLWADLSLFDRLKAAGLLPHPLPPLGSVGLCAVALALNLSSGNVLTAGLDFSFTLDRFHARSSPSHLEKLRTQNRFRTILNPEPAFRKGAFPAVSKTGGTVRSDQGLKTYRDLAEQDVAGDNPDSGQRLWDVEGPGLSFGLPLLSVEEACAMLGGQAPVKGREQPDPAVPLPQLPDREMVHGFILREQEKLLQLRDALTGAAPVPSAALEELLDYCGYLWAFFPECAGAGNRRPSAGDISFLKRVRTEIEPFLKDFEAALRELARCKD